MNLKKYTRGGKGTILRFVLIVFIQMGFLGVLVVDRSLGQLSQNSGSSGSIGGGIFSANGFPASFPSKGFRAGPFRIHPFVGAQETYTDNAFRTNSTRESDFVHVVAPGLQVQLPFASFHQAVIDYRANQRFSARFSENNVQRQNLTGQVLLNFPSGMNLNLSGGYTMGADARGSAVDVQSLEPTKWNRKTFIGQVETLNSQFGVRLRFRVEDQNFTNNNQGPTRDRLTSQGGVTVFGNVMPNTYALLNFAVTQQMYDQNIQLDSISYRVNTGLRWRATGKTSGEIQVGYQVLNFDHASTVQPAGSLLSSGGNGSETFQFSGNVQWQPTPRSNIRLFLSRSIEQSGVFGTSVFTQTGSNLNASYAIGTRTTLNSSFRYFNDNFENDQGNQTSQQREDDRFGGSLGITYQAIRWIGITARYEYEQRDSTLSRFEYYANSLMVSIQCVF